MSGLLVEDHSGGGLLRALVVFVPVYWLWVGTAIRTNQLDMAGVVPRLSVFAVALCAVFLALALPTAYDDLGLLFAVSYWVGRLVLGVGLVVARDQAALVNAFTVSIVLTGPMLVVGALVPAGPRELVWAVAALIDLATPTLLRRRLESVRYDAGHLTERFGLFVLIALGESLVAVGTSADPAHLHLDQGLAIAAAFALACGLWWVYFHFAADAMRYSMATAQVQLNITRLVLSYGHLLFIGGIIVVAVGLHEVIHDPVDHPSLSVALTLFGGCALYLAGFGFTRWAMFHLVSTTRLTAALVVLVLAPLSMLVPALVSLTLLVVVLLVLNLVEASMASTIGWRARLSQR